MKAIDFLNSSPHYFIFQKESNKTNFGGILFLIFLILMFFISLIYILDYALNEKYEIQKIKMKIEMIKKINTRIKTFYLCLIN